MNDSHLTARDGKVQGYVGPDAVSCFRALTLWSALKLYAKTGIIPTRGVGITKMLAHATAITGKKYTRKQVEQAAADVKLWADEMKAALPVIES